MKHLPKALLLALLVGVPAVGQTITWEGARDVYLGQGRSELMGNCSAGRELNQQGINYWGDLYQGIVTERYMRRNNISDQVYSAMSNGLAAAMAIACPEVR